jgi:hypothetical protein
MIRVWLRPQPLPPEEPVAMQGLAAMAVTVGQVVLAERVRVEPVEPAAPHRAAPAVM